MEGYILAMVSVPVLVGMHTLWGKKEDQGLEKREAGIMNMDEGRYCDEGGRPQEAKWKTHRGLYS